MKLKKIALAMALLSVSSYSFSQANTAPLKIGFITDMSGLYADIDGKGGAEAIQMAIDDFGGTVLGRKIELITADHQNKPDIASSKAREWIDQQNLNVIIGGSNSGTALATAKVTDEKKRVYINNGAGTSALTNEQCSPYTVHYPYDTIALSNVTAQATMDQGFKSWYFLTADYAFGAQLQKDATRVIEAGNGKVVGASKHPLNASDFSSFLLQAQNSGAQVLGLANAGGDTINSVKAASEFGINKKMKIVGLLVFLTDVNSIGIKNAQGLSVAAPWYWNQDDESRAFAGRFIRKMKKMPTFLHAADYSSVMTYLKAVKAVGTDEPEKVMAELKKTKINDMFTKNGYIRKDGNMIHDFYLYEVRKPEEVKQPWDYYKTIKKVPGEKAYGPISESKCAFIK
jgi:branched-chain amino acid transport system substrate-binding protein